jgi:NAD(P)-dependent dehydrogenase (short-subunit alcohol dehydrogenase family)/pimeloyl-ACP methyl ester carboxylesterase
MISASEEHVVASAGVRLAAVELGDRSAPTVVLLHGYPDTKEVWEEVAHRLAERFHVVAYDMRGAGGSSAPSGGAGYDLERLVDDFAAVTGAIVPGRAVHLVGHDWGSIAGWEMVTSPRLDGRVRSFTSISGPSLDHAGQWMRARMRRPTPRALAALAGQARRSWYIAAFNLPLLPELAWRTVVARRWPEVLRRREGVDVTEGYPAPTLAADAAHGVGLYRRNMRRRMRHPRPDAVTQVPVQLVIARRDHFVSPRLFDDLDRWAPVLRRRSVDSGHWLPRTHPALLAGWIGEFVDEVEAGRTTATPPATDPVRPFAGRLVLVTGAGSGIGRATAIAFAEAGARVLAVDIDAAAAERTAELARLCDAPAWALCADVADAAAMEHLDRTVAADHGVVDVLVNNAGIGVAGRFLDTSVEEWKRVLDVNLWGVLHGCRLMGLRMVERGQGGHIVNVASAAAFSPSRTLPAYSTSKAAVLMLSECLRAELAPQGVGVTAICPGFVATGITRTTRFVGRSADEQERLRERSTRLYRRRNFPPERVAAAILRAVTRDTAVVPVTVEARAMHLLSRAAPGVLRALAKIDAL